MVSNAGRGIAISADVFGYGCAVRCARPLLRILALVCALFLTSCGLFADVWEWNQKLTVDVLVDGKIVSGSAVSHVWWQEANAFDVYPSGYKGEATVVDLGQRGKLFALIGEETKYIAQYTLHDELGYSRGDYEGLLPAIMHFRGTKDVPRDRYPVLVTFTDTNNPKTIRKVDPRNLSATFGPGISLVRVVLEITDEKTASGKVEPILPWLSWPREKFLAAGGGITPLKIPGESIGRINFVWRGS
ncbi:hypothetical protein [Mesorhizobium sp. M7A.F.Ca.ET.027.03.2.1]|uniref:hypothetical protein n=1 Tax=Mesorhizobium sp. M7A.F.Ca.ET.027.03.2.1 TaxID=2496656 RepID=UPI000FCB7066|nr:hypothetical protein [Mesorhizobium sp. M7A.F.Ca.ET.027.03.2.1]RVD62882.1 hypothetical protein EN750_19625 [Mesorhizobium sp. M7A.F.Ca.ET.027.03.2.1]